jgi:hypothetical protein
LIEGYNLKFEINNGGDQVTLSDLQQPMQITNSLPYRQMLNVLAVSTYIGTNGEVNITKLGVYRIQKDETYTLWFGSGDQTTSPFETNENYWPKPTLGSCYDVVQVKFNKAIVYCLDKTNSSNGSTTYQERFFIAGPQNDLYTEQVIENKTI